MHNLDPDQRTFVLWNLRTETPQIYNVDMNG